MIKLFKSGVNMSNGRGQTKLPKLEVGSLPPDTSLASPTTSYNPNSQSIVVVLGSPGSYAKNFTRQGGFSAPFSFLSPKTQPSAAASSAGSASPSLKK
jgi:hypothetical protein